MKEKHLLVRFTTERDVDGTSRKVTFPAKSTVSLTEDEIDLLDRLTRRTGKLHYREPVREGRGRSAEIDFTPFVAPSAPGFAGADVPVTKKTIAQLKAFIEAHDETPAGDSKKDLLAQAQEIEARLLQGDDDIEEQDLDAGL